MTGAEPETSKKAGRSPAFSRFLCCKKRLFRVLLAVDEKLLRQTVVFLVQRIECLFDGLKQNGVIVRQFFYFFSPPENSLPFCNAGCNAKSNV